MLQPINADKILDLWARKPLDFDPGTRQVKVLTPSQAGQELDPGQGHGGQVRRERAARLAGAVADGCRWPLCSMERSP